MKLDQKNLSPTILRRSVRVLAAGSALMASFGIIPVALAAGTISNDATATGTYNATPYTSSPSSATVPVADPTLSLTVVKTGTLQPGGDGHLNDGDTISYTIDVTNASNVTVSNVSLTEDGATFNGTAGAGSFDSVSPATVASLAPGATTQFTITYTLTAVDIYRAAAVTDGVVNSVTANATGPGSVPVTGSGSSQNTIAADPAITVAKVANLTTDTNSNSAADVGDVVTYTYTVTNTGNVPLSGVTINDTHEPGTPHELVLNSATATSNTTGPWDEAIGTDGPLAPGTASSDASVDGSFDLLQPGATATFTYVHTVTQAEFDAQ